MAQEQCSNNGSWRWDEQHVPFLRIFKTFRQATKMGQLLLALGAVVTIFLYGSLLDRITPPSSRVLSDGFAETHGLPGTSELEVFVSGQLDAVGGDPGTYHEQLLQNGRQQLTDTLASAPLNLPAEEIEEQIELGQIHDWVEEKYKKALDTVLPQLETRYKIRCQALDEQWESGFDLDLKEEKQKAEQLAEDTYRNIFTALVTGTGLDLKVLGDVRRHLVVVDETLSREQQDEDRERVANVTESVRKGLAWATAYHQIRVLEGRGVFRTMMTYTAGQVHAAATALIFRLDFGQAGKHVGNIIKGGCWLVRYHAFFAIVFGLGALALMALFGGAICRTTALQIAAHEHVGAWRALQFSSGRFLNFYGGPLLGMIVIVVVGILIAVGNVVGLIPGLGEILASLLLGLSFIGAAVIALMIVGLGAGYKLMFPAAAVEGSEGFDVLSRSFAYVLGKPWHYAFYVLLTAVYGCVCYLFVRLFAFLILAVTHGAAGVLINADKAGKMPLIGKLDMMWEAPSFDNLVPTIHWMGLTGTEAFGAAMIWLWVALIAGLVMAFLLSFSHTACTTIYFLLRQKVDATDIEDIYVEEDALELLRGNPTTPEIATEPAAEQPSGGSEDNQPATG